MIEDPADFVLAHGPEALQAVIDQAPPITAHLARAALRGEAPDRKLRARASVLPCSTDDLRFAAAYLLKVADDTDRMLRAENEDRGADRERKAIAAVALGRCPHEVAARVPLEAITGGPRLLAWTCALRALRGLGEKGLRRRGRGAWRLTRGLVVEAPIAGDVWGLFELQEDALRELDRSEELGGSRGDVEALGTLIDVRARLVESELVDVLGAIGRGAPLLETGERLRRALRAWEG